MKKLTLFLALLTLFSACKNQIEIEETFIKTEKKTNLINANNQFAFNFFKEIATNNEENYMVSPVSLTLALGMLYNGAGGNTKTIMGETLGFSNFSSEELSKVNYEISNALEGDFLQIANSNWIDKKFLVKENFIHLNKTYYNAEIRTEDFSEPQTVHKINTWVDEKTNHKIDKIIDAIPSNAVMYLINAIYFKATWKYQFDPKLSQKGPFYIQPNHFKMVDMMSLESDTILYLKNNTFSSVILPYKGEKYSMTLLQPNKDNKISTIIEVLNTNNWLKWKNKYKSKKLKITLPKFKFAYEKQLNNELSNLGLENIFENPNLNGISNSSLTVSSVLQKTYIDVNEKGTEAAAVTSVTIETTSASSIPLMIFNKPFLFIIREKETGTICFMGKIGNPEYQ